MGLGDELSKFIPKDFGKKKKDKAANQQQHASEKTGADTAAPSNTGRSAATDSRKETRGPIKAADSVIPDDDIPASQHVLLTRHQKAVSAIAWDPTGDSLATGEHGPNMHLWDFPTMDRSFQPYRTIVPFEGQQIHALKYNAGGTLILCATGDPRAKLFTPEGRAAGEGKRGDMYVTDMRRTTGHVSGLTSADWDPRGESKFVTAAGDATLRFWDSGRAGVQEQVVVARTKARARVAVTACAFSADGTVVASAQHDGGLSLWPTCGPFLRPTHHVTDAHAPATETSAVAFVPSNANHLISRGGDATVRLWDVRNMVRPLATAAGLPAAGAEANVAFSPDGSRVLVGLGSGLATPSSSATIAVLDTTSLSERRRITLPLPGDVLSIAWHHKINQIAAGLSTGTIAVTYDADLSTRGARLGVGKRVRQQFASESSMGEIITPNALPLFREDRPASTKRRREKVRNDPVRSHRPDMPVSGHGKGGAIGVNETQHIMKSIIKDTIRDEDPREALLRYAAVAEEDPKFISPLYKKTQDKPIFDESGMADEPEMKRRK
ncbi:hypothetical protein IWW50_003154 [Coemansia erecta]|nr:hypothetical protein IWW50_003154 [Coemansia erecta]